ncbi:putative ABC transport system ATP-binding protein [Paenibacillus sp. yr247]|uniref:ABC transporter ATP-binding protein n=1 Tax=Paenibacillus sp. yr247 TaxID=1761880 RepID=UPI000882367F|nr:ATP-binding cassette domain-containing protein [Paenibacillus sp. yr247]SDO10789.1 putative ABC transport system ATP-binding protein [Paenibacillus sp. yr247]
MQQPILVIEQLHKKHPNGTSAPLFEQISTNVLPQDRIAILGPSGQGKSTLLRVIATLEHSDGGSLSLYGRLISSWGPSEWRKRVCYVPQQPAMLPTTVGDNLAVVSKLHKRNFDQPLAKKLMGQVGLDDLDWSQKAADLSGGQKQRVQLVRSMLLKADILLLDEVTSALDVESKQAVENTLMKWHEEQGTGLIWVTHEHEQARRISNRFWYLDNGALSEAAQNDIAESVDSSPVEGDEDYSCLR